MYTLPGADFGDESLSLFFSRPHSHSATQPQCLFSLRFLLRCSFYSIVLLLSRTSFIANVFYHLTHPGSGFPLYPETVPVFSAFRLLLCFPSIECILVGSVSFSRVELRWELRKILPSQVTTLYSASNIRKSTIARLFIPQLGLRAYSVLQQYSLPSSTFSG